MSAAELLYSFRVPYGDVLERGRTQAVALEAYHDGALVAPNSGTFTLYDPAQGVVTTGAVTIASSVATYSIPGSSLPATLDLGEGYLEVWALAMPDGTTRTVRRAASLARVPLNPAISDIDLLAEYPNLDSQLGNSVSNFQGFIDEAWKRLMRKLVGRGVLTYLVVDPDAIVDAHRELALYLTFKWMFRQMKGDTRFGELMTTHLGNYRNALDDIKFTEDGDHDGFPDNSTRHSAGTVVHLNAAPQMRHSSFGRW